MADCLVVVISYFARARKVHTTANNQSVILDKANPRAFDTSDLLLLLLLLPLLLDCHVDYPFRSRAIPRRRRR